MGGLHRPSKTSFKREGISCRFLWPPNAGTSSSSLDKTRLVDQASVARRHRPCRRIRCHHRVDRPRRGGPADARVDAVPPAPGDHGHAHRRDRSRRGKRPRRGGDVVRALVAGRRSASSANQVAAQDLARRLLGLPDDRFCAWLIALGYRGIACFPRCATRTGGRSTRWFTAIGGDRHRHAGGTRIRRCPIRARWSATGESGSPDAAGGTRAAEQRWAEIGGRHSRTRPWSSRAQPSPRTPSDPGPATVTGSAHRTLRGYGGWRSTWRSRGDSLRTTT
jgi:hypothetical protein